MTTTHQIPSGTGANALDVRVTLRGEVPERLRTYIVDQVADVSQVRRSQVISAHVTVVHGPDRTAPYRAEATLGLAGTLVHARAQAREPHEAVDLLNERLRRQLDEVSKRREDRRRHTGRPADTLRTGGPDDEFAVELETELHGGVAAS